MVVRGPRLSLQLLRAENAHPLYEPGRNPEISRFFSWRPYESVSEAAAFVDSLDRQREAGERLELGIFDEYGQLLGITGFSDFSQRDRRAVLGTWLGRPYWGSG